MEMLTVLEKKIESLVDFIKRQKEDISRYQAENQELKGRVGQLETALLKEAKRVEQELTQERTATRQAVDDLIKSIDDLIDGGGSQ